MKTLEELGISPAPWVQGKICDDMILSSDLSFLIATTEESGIASVNNARLIVAAPELYGALMEVYEQICAIQAEHDLSHAEGENTCDECYNTVAWISKARAALEKAGGAE